MFCSHRGNSLPISHEVFLVRLFPWGINVLCASLLLKFAPCSRYVLGIRSWNTICLMAVRMLPELHGFDSIEQELVERGCRLSAVYHLAVTLISFTRTLALLYALVFQHASIDTHTYRRIPHIFSYSPILILSQHTHTHWYDLFNLTHILTF